MKYNLMRHILFITLMCTYALHGYAFGRVGLYVVYFYVCQQKTGCLLTYHWKSPAECILLLSH